jgi:DNA polymerase-1
MSNTKQRKKLAIIDGKSVFYRGYYAMGSLSTKDGIPTGGVYGFVAMSLELLKKLKPDYVCVAWDKPKTNIRSRLAVYPDYKAGRKAPPADFYTQIPILHEVLKAFNWPLYELDDYEADDIMYGLAKKAEVAGLETMLITSDLDALQGVSEHTHVYALKKGFSNIERFDIAAFETKYGINTNQFLDLKSLKGDSSDNIPGVPGIGEKGALDLIKQYGSLDAVYDNLWQIKDSLRRKLEAGKDSAYMSREIARLYDDAPIELDLTEMSVHKLDSTALHNILTKLEFRSLIRQLPESMKASEDAPVNPNIRLVENFTDKKFALIDSNEKLQEFTSRKFTDTEVVVFSRSAGSHGAKPVMLSVVLSNNTYVVDLRKVTNTKLLRDFFTNRRLIGYDTKNLMKLLIEIDVNLPTISHDILIANFIINSLSRARNLTELAQAELQYEADFESLDDDQIITRAAEVCAVISAIAVQQSEKMSELPSLIQLADKVDYPVVPVLASMERKGIKLNEQSFSELSNELADRISDVEQTIYGYADREFNISSPAQLSTVLFEDLSLPTMNIKKGKSGSYSTASDVLEKLKQLHPIIELVENYREFTKLKNTYVDTLPTMIDETSKVHTTFNMTVAQTGRLSSEGPNLQNIPVRTELGKQIRRGFEAEEGNVFVSADYSQFELRIAAAMSEDDAMIAAFNDDRDIHTETAALIHGVTSDQVTKEQRYAAKAVNFGVLYGQGVHGLSSGTGISYAEAKQFIDRYFEVRPKLKGMIEKFRHQALERGYVETLLGRRRLTPDAKSSNFIIRESAFRAAVNMPIQGTAADLTKLAMVAVDAKLPDGASQILQIHDSIMVECREQDAEKVGAMMKQTMESIYPGLGVNLRVDISSGKTWADV